MESESNSSTELEDYYNHQDEQFDANQEEEYSLEDHQDEQLDANQEEEYSLEDNQDEQLDANQEEEDHSERQIEEENMAGTAANQETQFPELKTKDEFEKIKNMLDVIEVKEENAADEKLVEGLKTLNAKHVSFTEVRDRKVDDVMSSYMLVVVLSSGTQKKQDGNKYGAKQGVQTSKYDRLVRVGCLKSKANSTNNT
eukprot:scaffold16580_cov37-Cyclotella_meneghiniana.AAC.4